MGEALFLPIPKFASSNGFSGVQVNSGVMTEKTPE
jgi:hypothetical protein